MRLLVVGKLSGQLSNAVKMAMSAGAKVSHVETIEAATHALRAGQGADLLMVDYDLDIAALIAANEIERIRVPVVACGVGADPKRAADAIRAGAKEFIPLPPEASLIAAVLAAVSDDNRPMIVRDPAMQGVIDLADQVAASDASILITGESGVGKEVVARYLHQKSRRANRPFISVNCAARICWKASCSATRRAPSPARSPAGSASSKRPMAAPCCWTKSPRWTGACRPSCSAPCRSAKSTGSAGPSP
jgi:two-component system, response regulator FlrC